MKKNIQSLETKESCIIHADDFVVELYFFEPGKFANATVEYDSSIDAEVYQGNDYIFIEKQQKNDNTLHTVTINLPNDIKTVEVNSSVFTSEKQTFNNSLSIKSRMSILKKCNFPESVFSSPEGKDVFYYIIESSKINRIRFKEGEISIRGHSTVKKIEQMTNTKTEQYTNISIQNSHIENINIPFSRYNNLFIKNSIVGNVSLNKVNITFDNCTFIKGKHTTVNEGKINLLNNNYKIQKGFREIRVKEEKEEIYKFRGKIKLLRDK